MYKKLRKVISVVVVFCILTFSAFATSSGYKSAPASVAGSFSSKSTTYKCYSAAATAQGSATYVYFRNYGSLQSNFVPSNSRKMTVRLYDEDVLADDLIKTYIGDFKGNTLSYINSPTTNISGNIEPNNENDVELFIKYKVDKMTGDPASANIASGLFQFNVGIN